MSVPKEIKLGDTTFTVADHPELLAALNAARTEEKTKLYKKVEDLETELKTLGKDATAKERKELNEKLEKAEAELKELKEGKTDDPEHKSKDKSKDDKMDVAATIKAALAEQEVKYQEALKKQQEENDEKLNKLTSDLTSKVAADYREELLEKHKGQIIPQMLKGNTKEELDASLKEVLEVSKDYLTVEVDGKKLTIAEKAAADAVAAAEATRKSEEAKNFRSTDPPERKEVQDGKTLLADVSKMSESEYAKHRNEIMQAARASAAGGGSE